MGEPRALLLRPGFLTAEFFAERRQRYLPPVRLYLVLSVLCFALVSVVRPPGPTVPGAASVPPPRAVPADTATHVSGCEVRTDSPLVAALLRWPAMQRGCARMVATEGRSLVEAVQRNVPRMMFVFLPLLAAAMRLLYWRPRRWYVEHLVLCLHNHAALYLALILLGVLQHIAAWWPAFGAVADGAAWLVWLYASWYLWRALRRYYGQGRLLTALKLGLLGITYFAFLLLTLSGTMVVSLLQG
ncbi:MAG: DUF3667 domain-containing protein [Steroidobacteraceae bacterium]